MIEDIFLPLYFSGLYPPGNEHKISLYSSEFYRDIHHFYKSNESNRKNVIQGIKYLTALINDPSELFDIKIIWEKEKQIFALHGIFEGALKKTKLSNEFMNDVSDVLDQAFDKLNGKIVNEVSRLREKNKRQEFTIVGLMSNKKDTKEVKPPTGFQSSLSDDQVANLYSKMQGTYIEATPDNFKAIFKSEPLPQVLVIKWKDSNRLLGYFLEQLMKNKHLHRNTNINLAIKKCFIDQHGSQFSDSIRQNRSGSGNNKNNDNKPKGFKDIDTIINGL